MINMIDEDVNLPLVHLGFFCLYWLQYSLNFFIYAARSEQFRKAYSYFLKMVWEWICCSAKNEFTTTTIVCMTKNQRVSKEFVSAVLESLPGKIGYSVINPSEIALNGSLEELKSTVIIIRNHHRNSIPDLSDFESEENVLIKTFTDLNQTQLMEELSHLNKTYLRRRSSV